MNVFERVFLFVCGVMVIMLSSCRVQKEVAIRRIVIEQKGKERTVTVDTIIMPSSQMKMIDVTSLYPDTLHFHNCDVLINLPVGTLKQISYFEGAKIHDLIFEHSIKSEDCKEVDVMIPLISCMSGGCENVIWSLGDSVETTNKFADESFADEFGEKTVGTLQKLHYRKRKIKKGGITLMYMNIPNEKVTMFDYVIDQSCIHKHPAIEGQGLKP